VNATILLFVHLQLRKRRSRKRNAVDFADFNHSGHTAVCPCHDVVDDTVNKEGKPQRWTPDRVPRNDSDKTLVLETDFQTQHSVTTVVDFMPMRGSTLTLSALCEGNVARFAAMELTIRFDYGRSIPWVAGLEDACN
jgi:hypothetical protein